jgi:hypothetical protein
LFFGWKKSCLRSRHLALWGEQQLAELKEMVAEFGINSGGELLAQLIVRPTYQEQIL